MKPLHICYVEAGYPHPHGGGGAGTYIRLVGRELVRRGHRVSVVAGWCPDCPPRALDDGIAVFRPLQRGNFHHYASKLPGLCALALPLRYLEEGWRWFRLLEGLHRKERFNVVEFTEGGDFLHAFRASFPCITHLHGSRYSFLAQSARPLSRGDGWQRRLELAFIRRARLVLSPSRHLFEVVKREMKGPMPPEIVIPLPLDPLLLRDGLTEEADRPRRGGMVLFAARDDPVKGAAVLLEAVPIVRRQVPEATFVLIGPRPSAGTICPDGVQCHPFMPKEQLLTYYRQADLVVVPSLWDNSPNTVYEAMAAGRAVVASRVGGIPEVVSDGETGLLVPPGNVPALAEAISRLLIDQPLRTKLGLAGRQRIVGLANLEANIDRRLAVYEQVAAGPPLSRSLTDGRGS
jgi:glycosyltransferase involved in cell wall biosynthesis